MTLSQSTKKYFQKNILKKFYSKNRSQLRDFKVDRLMDFLKQVIAQKRKQIEDVAIDNVGFFYNFIITLKHEF